MGDEGNKEEERAKIVAGYFVTETIIRFNLIKIINVNLKQSNSNINKFFNDYIQKKGNF